LRAAGAARYDGAPCSGDLRHPEPGSVRPAGRGL